MLSHREPHKAQRYLTLLDEARCSANWDEVSRLRLKIAKYLPERKCLQGTVATEYFLSTQVAEHSPTSSSPTPFDYAQRVPELLTALKHGNPTAEDTFQAEVCLAWLHWTIDEPTLALSRLPTDLAHAYDRLTQTEGKLAGWTHVCIVKGGYLQGICQENTGDLSGAAETYKSMLQYILKAETLSSALGEQKVWIERLLARYCLLLHGRLKLQAQSPQELLTSSSPIAFTLVLTPFRAWAESWDASSRQTPKAIKSSPDRGDVPQRLVWHAYYDTLSMLIRIRSIFPPLPEGGQILWQQAAQYDVKFFSETKSQQYIELKQVQSIYEKHLVNELSFPKANEATPEIDNWVDQVIDNWKIICGPAWRNEDHVGGGKEATSRTVLEVLYRAAARSFHSTRILRHLFTVHTSLAEYELGQKALDSYFEIVTKGKARVEKSGQKELGLDDDATAIYTAATGIKSLCLHNRWEEAKKSQMVCDILEEWLREHYIDPSSNAGGNLGSTPNVKNGENSATKKHVSPKVLAAGFCAVGISQAHWANLTYETSERAAYQSKSISNFRIASRVQSGDHLSTEDLCAFALALSKNRNIDSAVGVIKQALSRDAADSIDDVSSEIKVDGSQSLYTYKRRQMLRCWHLLALLLSAKQNFSTAIASCKAALELFGLGSTTSDQSLSPAAIENIEFSDRESIIEISMTHLALSEVVDGPEEAVNDCRDLLTLYGKFFGHPEMARATDDVTRSQVSPPASRHGTIKSFRSSFLGRSRDDNRKPPGTKLITRSPVSSSVESFSGVPQKTPTISVTAEDSSTYHGTSHHSHHFFHHESRKLRKGGSKRSVTSARRSHAASMIDGPNANGIEPNSDILVPKDKNGWPPEPWSNGEQAQNSQSFAADEVGVAISHDSPPVSRPIAAVPVPSSNAQISQPIPLTRRRSHPSSSAAPQHLPLPRTYPAEPLPPPPPLFPIASRTRRSLTILTRIWLQVASLYRRANMPTDASGAVSEASAQVSTIENLVAFQHSSAEIFSTTDWGGVPSVSELWADVFSERARLHELLGEQDEAEADYETALTHFPDHPGAIIGLSNILLDFYSQPTLPNPSPPSTPKPTPLLASIPQTLTKPPPPPATEKEDNTLLPRLSARDRAAGLLSSLTKNGQGWDCAEAWFALGRAYELRGQIDKAKEALWWVVELEETRPIRGWRCLGW